MHVLMYSNKLAFFLLINLPHSVYPMHEKQNLNTPVALYIDTTCTDHGVLIKNIPNEIGFLIIKKIDNATRLTSRLVNKTFSTVIKFYLFESEDVDLSLNKKSLYKHQSTKMMIDLINQKALKIRHFCIKHDNLNGFKHLVDAIINKQEVLSLKGKVGSNHEELTYIVQLLRKGTCLKTLMLPSFAITDEQVRDLGIALTQNTALTELTLNCCKINSHGADYLSELLTSNTALKALTLCELYAGYFTTIATAMKHNKTLAKVEFMLFKPFQCKQDINAFLYDDARIHCNTE
jgi:hypothetical protein